MSSIRRSAAALAVVVAFFLVAAPAHAAAPRPLPAPPADFPILMWFAVLIGLLQLGTGIVLFVRYRRTKKAAEQAD